MDRIRIYMLHPLAAAKMLQHLTAMYSFSYISCLQLAAKYESCSQWILMFPPILVIICICVSVVRYSHSNS